MGLKKFKPADWMVFVLLGFLSSALVVFAYWYKPPFLVGIDLKALDAMFAARKSVSPPKDIVIVAVDERSVKEVGRWPWTRTKTAALIKRLKSATILAVDMVFSETENAQADNSLSREIEESGNVILGYFFRDDSTVVPTEEAVRQIKRSKINIVSFMGPEGFPYSSKDVPAVGFSGVDTNIPKIGKGAIGFGAFNIIPQEDGVYRLSNLVYKYRDGLYPTLALEAIRRYYNGEYALYAAPYGIDSIEINGHTIPLDEQGSLLLNFYGKGGSFTTYPAVDVLNGTIPADTFKGKLVFLGVTEKGIYDIRPTPLDTLFPGVELLATAAGNVMDNRYLVHDTRVVMLDIFMIVFVAVLLSILLSFVHTTFVSLMIFAGVLLSLVLADFYLFSAYSLRPQVVYPAFSVLLAYLSDEAYRNIVVEKKSRYLRKAFSTYVSKELVTELLKYPDRLKLGGEKRIITVLFSDIRGFTTLSEKMNPEELVTLLNEYLSPMTQIILGEEGTLDKYIGDAIMAVFNAPVDVPDHPRRACLAAIRMMSRLKELNGKWIERAFPRLDIGIGINTGEAVVGNMGAEVRFNYTAIGDTVNLASRLEGMNKLYGTGIIVSEYTHEAVKNDFLFRELDLVRVKGKLKPIVMYELVSGRTGADYDAAVGIVKAFSEALSLYRARRFNEAKEAFEEIFIKYPEDSPSALYAGRCAQFINSPPPDDWDGVFVAKTK